MNRAGSPSLNFRITEYTMFSAARDRRIRRNFTQSRRTNPVEYGVVEKPTQEPASRGFVADRPLRTPCRLHTPLSNDSSPPTRFCLTFRISCPIISPATRNFEDPTPKRRRVKDASPSPWRAQQGEIHLFKIVVFAAQDANVPRPGQAPPLPPHERTVNLRLFFCVCGVNFRLTRQGSMPDHSLCHKSHEPLTSGCPLNTKRPPVFWRPE